MKHVFLKRWVPLVSGLDFFSPKKTNLRWLCFCLDFFVFELRLQLSNQRSSELLGESTGVNYMSARTVARTETAPPPTCIAQTYENLVFLSLLFWRAAPAQPRARPYNVYQWIVWVIHMFFDYLVAIAAQKIAVVSLKKIGFLKKNSNFQMFSNFKETYNSEFLSYYCNQVVKKHLNY